MTAKILNDGLELSMEFGENWLADIDERLSLLYPELNATDLLKCNQLCRQVGEMAHEYIRKNPIRDGASIRFIAFEDFEAFMKERFKWINSDNLSRLYSQSCYYAWK